MRVRVVIPLYPRFETVPLIPILKNVLPSGSRRWIGDNLYVQHVVAIRTIKEGRVHSPVVGNWTCRVYFRT